jgi:hypothetical protein
MRFLLNIFSHLTFSIGKLGNLAGISLVIFSGILSNSDSDSQIWERHWKFYVGIAAPCFMALIASSILTSIVGLLRPERITVSIESAYQNVGIATSVALSMFQGDELAEAMGVPFFYGIASAVFLFFYCLVAWKAGWTKAPRNVSLWKAITTSYEIKIVEKLENLETIRKDPDIEDFYYVQYVDTMPDDALPENNDGFEIAVRRDHCATKKEPSEMENSYFGCA